MSINYESVLLSALSAFLNPVVSISCNQRCFINHSMSKLLKKLDITSKGRHKNEGNIVDKNTKLGLSMHYTITVAHRQKAMHSSNAPNNAKKIFKIPR